MEDGAVVVLTSPISLTFLPGFLVLPGSDFTAKVEEGAGFTDPCTASLVDENPAEARNLNLSNNQTFQNGLEVSPNPFFDVTKIQYEVATTSPVSIMVFNSSGMKIADLLNNQEQLPGNYQVNFSACLLYTSPSPRDATLSRMPSSA